MTNRDLPKSKKVAMAWVEEVFEKMIPSDESTVKEAAAARGEE
jgi:hypothetical protein